LVTVTTGLYNENYMEVTGGLKEGDIVVLPRQASNTTTATRGQPAGGFSMPGGGMFGGSGMPGGGSFFGGGGRR
jgi:HlyD family secretion protein